MEILSEARFDCGHSERPLVVAYFTEGTPYEGEAEVLKESLESIGYDYYICGVPNLKSWQKNTQYKAVFLQEMLKRNARSLLYLDVDSIMIQAPILLDDLKADIAAVHFAYKSELLSGTIYLGNTKQCERVIQKWIYLNEQYPETLPNGKAAWDQRTLALAIKKIKGVNFIELPQSYTWIVGLTQKHIPDSQPIIMHTRGAKKYKRRINGLRGYEK